MKILNKLIECKQWIIRIVMMRYSVDTEFDKVYKEFVIRKQVAIKPLDKDFENKFSNDIYEHIERLNKLGFIAVTRYLNGNKTAELTEIGRSMFFAVY